MINANQNFLALQEELSATEGRVAYARQFYNDSVLDYNNAAGRFPANLVARLLGFAPAAMLHFLLNVTGIPLTEKLSIKKRGDAYRDYQRTTSAFVPWFKKT